MRAINNKQTNKYIQWSYREAESLLRGVKGSSHRQHTHRTRTNDTQARTVECTYRLVYSTREYIAILGCIAA